MRLNARSRSAARAILVATMLATTAPASAKNLIDDGPLKVNLMVLVQATGEMTQDGSPDGDSWAADVYMRRLRLILSGQVTENVKFFLGTAHVDLGRDGKFSTDMTTADAWVELDLHRAFKLDAGLLMIPFLHNTRQLEATSHTLDLHNTVRMYPTTAQFMGRDVGLGARGLVLHDRLNYWFNITRGTWADENAPRLTGRAAFNVFDPEEDYFLHGTYFGKKKVLSFGLGVDMQPSNGGLDKSGELTTYWALGGDVFLDYPIGPNGITSQVGVAYYNDSIRGAPGSACGTGNLAACSSFTGTAVLSELGYRIKKIGMLAGFDWTRPDGSDSFRDNYARIFGGLNYWIAGHGASAKLEYSFNKEKGVDFGDGYSQVVLQVQAFVM